MEILLYFLGRTAMLLLWVLDIGLFLRAVLSWFDPEMSFRFSAFLYTVTEPVIQPIRKLCYKMNWFQRTPIDVPFMITVLLVILAQMLLESL
ncbi:MAG: YggT family protein [Clostridia bacterium]|nr:YggT family protein [Clostridia bacterium]